MNVAELLKTMKNEYNLQVEIVPRSSVRVITYSVVCAKHMIFVTIARYDNARFAEIRIVDLQSYNPVFKTTVRI